MRLLKVMAAGVLLLALLVVALACSSDDKDDDFSAQDALNTAVAMVESEMNGMLSSLESAAATAEVKSGQWDQMEGLLNDLKQNQAPAVIWFVLPDGSYWTVSAGKVDANLSNREYFPGLMAGGNVFGDTVVSKSTGKKSAVMAVPVSVDGEVIGGLGGSIFLDELSANVAQSIDLPQDMLLYAVDKNGEIVLDSDSGVIFEQATQLPAAIAEKTSAVTGWRFGIGYIEMDNGDSSLAPPANYTPKPYSPKPGELPPH